MQSESRLETLCEAKFVRLVRRGHWEFAQRKGIKGIVAIVPVTDDGKLVLVEQYRPPVEARVIEIPAGLAGDIADAREEELVEAARRELEEETGFRAAKMERLVAGAASAGITDEIITLFLATGLTKVGDGGGDEHEDIEVHVVPLDEVHGYLLQRAAAGVVIDVKVYAALFFARR